MVSTFYIIFVSDRLHLGNLKQASLHSICAIFAEDRLHHPISIQRYGKSAVWQNNLPKIQIIITST